MNRSLVDHVADFNLVYTEHARRNLLAEGLPARRIALTGSPMGEVLDLLPSGNRGFQRARPARAGAEHLAVASVHREENVDEAGRLALMVDP